MSSSLLLLLFLSGPARAAAPDTAVSVSTAAPRLPYGKLLTDGPRTVKEVALTFDDGPSAVTGELLDLLRARHVQATFFVLGRSMRAHPGLVRRMIAEGHQVGLHSDTHPDLSKVPEDKRVAKLEQEIARNRETYATEDGAEVHFMRIPYGYDRPWVKEVARREQLVLVNWTFGDDWKRLSEEEMTREYRRHLHNGSILLMHDGGIRGSLRVVHVTKALLDTLEEKHLKPVRLDTLLGLENK
jgi:peptidoglycan/xylan/chitin deacetylase (PgdA/CDA1 family)